MNYGVVVVGYQGIGKSTTASKHVDVIDLESSNFYTNGRRNADWYKAYCNIAIDLASQGYVVFTSSHKEVREYLTKTIHVPSNVQIICCVPDIHLKDQWINRLWDRWRSSQLDKDFKAYANAEDRFEANVSEIKYDIDLCCELHSLEYNLYEELEKFFKIHGIDHGIYNLGHKVTA